MKWVLSLVITVILVPKLQPWVMEYIESEFINNVGIGIVVDVIVLSTALYYFVHYPTNIFLTQKESSTHNKKCILFGFFDNHDIWHILSSAGLYMFMNILLYIDYDLENSEKIDLSNSNSITNTQTFNDF